MVYGLGSNSEGQLGLGHNTPIHTPKRVPELCHKNIHQFFNGYNFVLAVNTDNNVIFSFGLNDEGQLGRDLDMDVNVYHKPETNVIFSFGHNYWGQLGRHVFGWGYNEEGQVGCGDIRIQLDPTPVEFTPEYQISKIECNWYTSLALTCEGQMFIWGKSFDVITKLGEGGYGQHIIHRDLKPDNVLISMEEEIKLCDFGLAKEVQNCDPFLMSKAKHTADVGTDAYMAPEAMTNEYNHLIDIYSLSLIGAQIFGFDTNDIINGNPQMSRTALTMFPVK
ncbi:unnamed protein product [Oppiella nova]|uniref:non-specific serine/threonine protein kinase n=1 Tax=Oppiella nova TaxID=334625 RepID=A0A7R9MAZ0_9ACAR|nr:unnamed protein product [Oppiella nova]CAG2172767.1 unnamed protein product [Oppiella nova]